MSEAVAVKRGALSWSSVILAALVGGSPARGQDAPAIPADAAVIELQVPANAKAKIEKVTIDGTDRGAGSTLVVGSLKDGAITKHQVTVRLSNGETPEWSLLLSRGWRVKLPITSAAKPLPPLVVQQGHTAAVNAVAVSPIGSWALTGGNDRVAILWDLSAARRVRELKGHAGWVLAVAFSPDGRRALTGSADKTAKLWDVETGAVILTLEGHDSGVLTVGFSADGKQVVTGSFDDTARWWDTETGKELGRVGNNAVLRTAIFAPDGRHVLTAGAETRDGVVTGTATLWSTQTKKPVRSLSGHTDAVTSAAFSASGRHVVTGSKDRSAVFWDVSGEPGSERRLKTFGKFADPVLAVALSGDGKQLLVGTGDRRRPDQAQASLYDVDSGNLVHNFLGHADEVRAVAFSRDGRQVVTGSADKTAVLWDVQTGKPISTLQGEPVGFRALAVCRPKGTGAGAWLVVGCSSGQTLLFDMEQGRPIRTFAAKVGSVEAVAASADGQWIVTAANGPRKASEVTLWNGQTGERVHAFTGHADHVHALALSADGKLLLTGSTDQTAILWETATGRKQQTFAGHKGAVRSVALDAAGARVLTGSFDGTARLWDAANGRILLPFEEHGNAVSAVAFSPDGRTALTGSWDRTAILWDTASGKVVRKFAGHGEVVTAAAFDPQGRLIVTGAADQTALVWDAATGDRLRTFQGHGATVFATAFSPDGRQVLTCAAERTIRFWDVAAGGELAQLIGLDQGRDWLVLTPRGIHDGSPDGRKKVAYQVKDAGTVPVDRFYEKFYQPGLMAAVWSGDRPVVDVDDLLRRPPPIVRFLSPDKSRVVETGRLAVEIEAENKDGGVKELALFLGNRRVIADSPLVISPDGKFVRRKLTVALDQGDNVLEVRARSDDQTESEPARLTVTYNDVPPRPSLFVLSVGVSTYKQTELNLSYAHKDAKSIAELFRTRGLAVNGQGLYQQVYHDELMLNGAPTKLLLQNDTATKANVEQALLAIKGMAKERDTVVVFLAGHGIMVGDRYYYLPHDCTFTAATRDHDIATRGLSAEDLGAWLKQVNARNRVLLLDTCYSAGANLSALGQAPVLKREADVLGKGHGIFVLAASTDQAKEFHELQHGVLTYTLLAGFGAVDRDDLKGVLISPLDREHQTVSIPEWFTYAGYHVPRLTHKYRKVEQTVVNNSHVVNHVPLLPLKVPG